MEPLAEKDFEELVGDALDALPDEILDLIDNVVILIEDHHETEDLLGLYEGIPHTDRDDYGGLALPDRIILYRLPLCELATDDGDLCEEVMVTIVHEIAHHFGIDDERLHELGWA